MSSSNNNTLVPSTLPYNSIATMAMEEVWSNTPRNFQREAIPYLLMMRCHPNSPSPLLLIQGTGGGKSAVPQTVGVVTRGVTLIIENTLSLSADQQSKIKRASDVNGPVRAFHLDSIKRQNVTTRLSKYLLDLDPKTNASIFLYTSPECLLKSPWIEVFNSLLDKSLLRLVCIDEVHQFVTFGLSFRTEFLKLKSEIFSKLKSTNSSPQNNSILKVPLLFMTATFNKSLVHYLQTITGLAVPPSNYLWADANGFRRRTVLISIHPNSYYMKGVKALMAELLQNNLDKKMIVYTNTLEKVENIHEDLCNWHDSSFPFEGDILLLHGDIEPEVKFASIVRFTSDLGDVRSLLDNNMHVPRVLVATAECFI